MQSVLVCTVICLCNGNWGRVGMQVAIPYRSCDSENNVNVAVHDSFGTRLCRHLAAGASEPVAIDVLQPVWLQGRYFQCVRF